MSLQPSTPDITPRPQAPAAIPIVAPTEDNAGSSPASSTKTQKAPTKRLCRNVIIYGFCKYEGKGCEFSHGTDENASPSSNNEKIASPLASAMAAQPFLANASSSSLTNVNAPVFIPRSMSNMGNDVLSIPPTTTAGAPSGPPHHSLEMNFGYGNQMDGMTQSFSQLNMSPMSHGPPPAAFPPPPAMPSMPSMPVMPPMPPMPPMPAMPPVNPYYINPPSFNRQPLQYHLYAPSLPHVSRILANKNSAQTFFLADDLRKELTKKNEISLAVAPPDSHMPPKVDNYHSLYPLEKKSGRFFGHVSSVYKAISSKDGKLYTLLRIEGFQLEDPAAMETVKRWRQVQHSNVVCLRESFTTRAFGDSSLVFVFDYHPSAETLFQHLQGRQLSVDVLWSYVIQIASALKTVHEANLAACTVDLKRILVTGKNRIRLNGVGVREVLQFDHKQTTPISYDQHEDLVSFGNLIRYLTLHSVNSFERAPEQDSADLMQVTEKLLSPVMSAEAKSINDILPILSPYMLQSLNSIQSYNDVLEHELGRELENSRLVRLLCKLGFINERPEFDMDPRWAETGDRYIIKLFRDYVFHQVDENGAPVLNMAHVLTCLNQLDAGVDEKLMLMSRDEQSCLVVSYKEIKQCIESAFKDLSSGRP